MENISELDVEQFWKEHFKLTPENILEAKNDTRRNSIIDSTFYHFTSTMIKETKDGHSTFRIATDSIGTMVLKDMTGYESLTSMKKFTKALNQAYDVMENYEKQRLIELKRSMLEKGRNQNKSKDQIER